MAGDRDELQALRRMAELEARSGQPAPMPQNVEMSPMQARMGIRGIRPGQGAMDVHSKVLDAFNNMGYEAGGLATDLSTKLGASPETAAKFGYGANVATDALPMVAGGVLGAASKVPEVLQGGGRWLMGTALKPSTKDWLSGNADKAIETMLEKGYNASKGGVLSMRQRIEELGGKISSVLEPSSKELNKEALIERLLPTYDKALTGGAPAENISAIGKVAEDFRNHPALAGHETVPIQLAQEMKKTMGKEIGNAAYGSGLKLDAERDAKKALVRALKEDISKAEPAVAPLNAEQSQLINAAKIAERRAASEGNANPAGLALLTHNPEAAIGFIADKWGLTKSLAARLLYHHATAIPASAGRIAGGAIGADMAKEP